MRYRTIFGKPRLRRALAGPAMFAAALVLAGCAATYDPCGDGAVVSPEAVRVVLRRDVTALASAIGERNAYRPAGLERAAAYIEQRFRDMGYRVRRQPVAIPAGEPYGLATARTVYNLEVVKPGTGPASKTLVIGAHYDTRVGMATWDSHGPARPARVGTPGANDNGSGVAALLRVAEALREVRTTHTLRFVAFVNEEPPFFRTDTMGSRVHARALVREVPADGILGMISLETLGCYSSRPNRKRDIAVAPGLVGLPDRCDYVAFLSTLSGRDFADACAVRFARNCRFPVRAAAFPYFTRGVSWSDDWSYMKEGVPAFSITDTAYLRCDDYHESGDTAEKLDYPQFAEVTEGIVATIRAIAE